MNWNRFSKLVLVCMVLTVAFASAAGAVELNSEDMLSDGEVGTQHTSTVQLTELYQNPSLETWTVTGSTEITDVTWTVSYYDQTNARWKQESYDGQTLTAYPVSVSDGTSEVTVKITGTVPEVDTYQYNPAQNFTVMTLTQSRQGGTSNELGQWQATKYTQTSREARAEIDAAASVVNSVNSDEADQSLQNAIDAYNGEQFELATQLANEAQAQAEQRQQSQQTQQFLFLGAGGVVVLALVIGAVLYWRSQRSQPDKLG